MWGRSSSARQTRWLLLWKRSIENMVPGISFVGTCHCGAPLSNARYLNGVVRSFDTRLEQADIRVQSAISNNDRCIIEGDEPRLTQLFSNLLQNTIRYTDNPGILRISYSLFHDTSISCPVLRPSFWICMPFREFPYDFTFSRFFPPFPTSGFALYSYIHIIGTRGCRRKHYSTDTN